ncbi:hypothetical protein Y032_0048g1601 [Ancylostoma ceylanicum]|uniref:Uncharacterized protein n=1 Tax=Ancylostoma ceylanicum TaxID=53326 RepID=A0A016UAB8_9BILA|nr:hypothetical protein Y032_0048g1601 [Ancylostoma ceylanicum]
MTILSTQLVSHAEDAQHVPNLEDYAREGCKRSFSLFPSQIKHALNICVVTVHCVRILFPRKSMGTQRKLAVSGQESFLHFLTHLMPVNVGKLQPCDG